MSAELSEDDSERDWMNNIGQGVMTVGKGSPQKQNHPDDEPLEFGSQKNWLAWQKEIPLNHVQDYVLLSDARFVSQITDGLGPYCLLNTIPLRIDSGLVNAPIVLRVAWHLPHSKPDFRKNKTSVYHGGTTLDEIAALVSLSTGARIRLGGLSREFWPDQGPLGTPRQWRGLKRFVV